MRGLSSSNVPYPHALLNIRRTNSLSQVDDELGDLLDVDEVLALVRILLILDDLGTSCHLQRLFLLHALSIGCNIPEMRRGETSV